MSTTHVVSALRAKRAEVSGDLLAAQKRLEAIRDDLEAIDRTLRIFDPNQSPESIRPVVKRKGDKLFSYGDCPRAVLNVLRVATEPLAAEQIAGQVALDCRITTETPGVASRLLWRVQTSLERLRKRQLVASEGKPPHWTLNRE
jgi:hypothetical protein